MTASFTSKRRHRPSFEGYSASAGHRGDEDQHRTGGHREAPDLWDVGRRLRGLAAELGYPCHRAIDVFDLDVGHPESRRRGHRRIARMTAPFGVPPGVARIPLLRSWRELDGAEGAFLSLATICSESSFFLFVGVSVSAFVELDRDALRGKRGCRGAPCRLDRFQGRRLSEK